MVPDVRGVKIRMKTGWEPPTAGRFLEERMRNECARFRRPAWAWITILVSGLACGPISDPSPRAAEWNTPGTAEAVALALNEWLPDQLAAASVPGAAVVVAGREGIVRERVFGVVDGPASPPVSPDTLFCIRSISKSVTALAVLTAVRDGLVDLDAPISKYLPDFTVRSLFDAHPEDLITLRMMLSHWAGFSHDPPQDLDLARPGYFRVYIDRISAGWLRFPVGYRFEYANRGVDLAAFIVETRSGLPFPVYVKTKVLDPLGMSRSTFDLEEAGRETDRAVGHDSRGNRVALPFPEIASAGLFSSLRDMARYVRFHLDGKAADGRRFLDEGLMREFHSIQFAARGQRTGYCLGLYREAVGDTFCLYHEGGGRGFGSHFIVYPELGFGVVILTNREYHGLTGEAGRNTINGPVINRFGPARVTGEETGRGRRLSPDDPRLTPILGRYGDSPGIVVGFEHCILGLRMSAERFVPLVFRDDDGFLVGTYDAIREVRFLPPAGGRPGAMMMVNKAFDNFNSHYRDFNDSPLDPPGPDKPEWRAYTGEYDEMWEGKIAGRAVVSVKNGYLYYKDGKCEELEPGLFFRCDGNILDFRTTPPNFACIVLRPRAG